MKKWKQKAKAPKWMESNRYNSNYFFFKQNYPYVLEVEIRGRHIISICSLSVNLNYVGE